MEHVVVHFVERRQVLVDDIPLGLTEDTLEVDEGHHTFMLDGSQNFSPESIDQAVTNTSVLAPLEFTFTLGATVLADSTEAGTPPSSLEPEVPNV